MDLYDELGLSANLRMELVAEKALASLLGPAGVDVFLPLLSRLIQPERLALARLDDLVLLGGVVLNANFREGGIDDARLPFGDGGSHFEALDQELRKQLLKTALCEELSVLPYS